MNRKLPTLVLTSLLTICAGSLHADETADACTRFMITGRGVDDEEATLAEGVALAWPPTEGDDGGVPALVEEMIRAGRLTRPAADALFTESIANDLGEVTRVFSVAELRARGFADEDVVEFLTDFEVAFTPRAQIEFAIAVTRRMFVSINDDVSMSSPAGLRQFGAAAARLGLSKATYAGILRAWSSVRRAPPHALVLFVLGEVVALAREHARNPDVARLPRVPATVDGGLVDVRWDRPPTRGALDSLAAADEAIDLETIPPAARDVVVAHALGAMSLATVERLTASPLVGELEPATRAGVDERLTLLRGLRRTIDHAAPELRETPPARPPANIDEFTSRFAAGVRRLMADSPNRQGRAIVELFYETLKQTDVCLNSLDKTKFLALSRRVLNTVVMMGWPQPVYDVISTLRVLSLERRLTVDEARSITMGFGAMDAVRPSDGKLINLKLFDNWKPLIDPDGWVMPRDSSTKTFPSTRDAVLAEVRAMLPASERDQLGDVELAARLRDLVPIED